MTETDSNAQVQIKQRRARWPWVLLALFMLITALVLVLPFALRAGAEYALRRLGAEQVSLEQVELSWWRGEVALHGLYIEDEGYPPLQLDRLMLRLAYRPLWSRRLVVEDVQLAGLQAVLDMTNEGMPHIGIQIPEPVPEPAEAAPEEPAEPWHFAIDQVSLAEVDFRALLPQFEAHWNVESLQFARLASWLPEQGSPLSLRSRFNGARLDLDGSSRVLDESRATRLDLRLEGLSLAGFQGFVREQLPMLDGRLGLDMQIALQLDGKHLQLRPTGRIRLDGLVLQDTLARKIGLGLGWDGAIQVEVNTATADTTLDLDGALKLSDLSLDLQPEQIAVQGDSLQWQGKTAVSVAGPGVGVDATGALDLAGLQLALSEQQLRLSGEALGWNGSLKLAPSDDAPGIAAAGDVRLANLLVADEAHRLRLAELGAAAITGVRFDGPQAIAVQSVQIDRVRALALAEDVARRMVALDQIQLDSIALDEQGLRIAAVALGGGKTSVLRQADGQLMFVERLGDTEQAAQEPVAGPDAVNEPAVEPAEEGATAEPLRIRIASLSLSSPHLIEFRDAAMQPEYAQTIQVNTLKILNIDTSSRSASSDLVLAASIGEFGSLDLKGTLTPLLDPDSGEIKLDLQAVELPRLTPYAVQAIGYELNRGQLNIDTRLSIAGREMDGQNKIFVRGLELTKADASRAEEFAASISMPLNSALSLLRDGDGNIELEVPIAGRTDAPDISIQDVINKALGTALKKAALSYVKYAIQPYGALIMLAEAASDAGQKAAMGLQPVVFQPGLADPGETGRDYLQKLSGLLQKRPEITLKLCGVSVPSDRAVLDTQPALADGPDLAEAPKDISMEDRLRALAERRVSVVKGMLVKEHGISAGRMLSCNPKLLDDAEATPEVQITI